jgi:2-iminobutanoate/2-iminopropanoate deaminase
MSLIKMSLPNREVSRTSNSIFKSTIVRKTAMNERQEHFIEGLSRPTAHYSDAVTHGDVCYLAGLLPLDANGKLAGGDDISLQAEQVLQNMSTALAQFGCTFADLIKINVYLTAIGDRAGFDAIRRKFFGTARPASTLVEVTALAVPGAKIEVEAIAALTSARKS